MLFNPTLRLALEPFSTAVARHFPATAGRARTIGARVLHAPLWRGPGYSETHTLDVFTSHFQAGDGAVHQQVRASQLAETLDFIRRRNDPARIDYIPLTGAE